MKAETPERPENIRFSLWASEPAGFFCEDTALELVVQYFAGGHFRKPIVYDEAVLQLKDRLLQRRCAQCSSITEE
ncbi:hypothetical protein D9C73_017964 [Collichthys lucidus]|uniref:Uncharacterized protein n=1 Tax=Collichthys lucidus TaxID=240159 RepID=A0A4U5V8Q8_COLLU|nr:hypothetical protein D9C73_017964 [Collichthys lucidus]